MVKQGFSKLRNKAEYSFNAGGQNIGQLEKGDLAGINCQLAVHQKQLEAENREIRESWALVKAARDFYLDLFNLAPVGYFVIDEHNRIIEANLTGCRLLQTDKRKIKNAAFTAFISESSIKSFYAHRRKIHSIEGEQTLELNMLRSDGSPFYANLEIINVEQQRLRVAVIDITAHKKTERELVRRNHQISAIMECDEAIIHSEDTGHLLSEICRILCTTAGYQLAWVGTAEKDNAKSIRPMVWCGADEYVLNANETWGETARGNGPAGFAVRTGNTQYSRDLISEPAMAPWKEAAMKHGFRTCIALPLADHKSGVLAVLSIYSRSPNSFGSDEVTLLEMLADDISFAVNAMHDREQRQKAEAEISRLATFPEFNPNPILELDAEGNIKYANPAARMHFPRMAEGLKHESLTDFINIAQKTEGHSINRDVQIGNSWFEQTLTWVPSTGSYLLFGRDVTAREQYEEKLRQRSAELLASNAQLESFSYSVSHDLRAPLRSLSGFSTALLEDYAGKLDREGESYLQKIKESAEHMELLIDDLLKLAKISRNEMNYEKLNLSDIGGKIIDTLQKSEPERKVTVEIEPGITAYGDRVLLGQVLDNLLGNAWKFTGKVREPRIEMGTTEVEGKTTYFVRDNGAGFNMEYADQLFKPFRRLHTEADFPGTGIGLAIVQQIIQRHGGLVRAEGKVGAGATFYFTLS